MTDTNAMPTSAMGWYYDLPEIEFDNATKVLQNPWMLRDNAGWLRCSDAAAWMKLPCSSRAMRWWSWRSFIGMRK